MNKEAAMGINVEAPISPVKVGHNQSNMEMINKPGTDFSDAVLS